MEGKRVAGRHCGISCPARVFQPGASVRPEKLLDSCLSLRISLPIDGADSLAYSIPISSSVELQVARESSARINHENQPRESTARINHLQHNLEGSILVVESPMSKGQTIALNLYDEHIEVLDQLAKRQGSRSGAVQRLLEEAKRTEIYRELDEAYQEYRNAGGEKMDHQLAEEMQSAASWPEEWHERGTGGRKHTRGKGRKAK